MARFVAMPVPSLVEHPVQTVDDLIFCLLLLLIHRFAMADHIKQSFRILGHIPGIMTGSSLGDEALAMNQVFIVQPFSILISAIRPARGRIDDIAPILGTAHQFVVIFLIFLSLRSIPAGIHQRLRHLRHGKIIVGILQGAGSLLVGMISFLHHILQRNVAIIDIRLDGTASLSFLILLIYIRCRESIHAHSLVSLLRIEVADALDIGIGKGGTGMIANHRSRITVPAREGREPATVLIHLHQRLHHLARTLRGDERIERELGTIDVPHREIIISDFFPHITHFVREEGTAIQGTVKLVDLCLVVMLHIDGMQTVAP